MVGCPHPIRARIVGQRHQRTTPKEIPPWTAERREDWPADLKPPRAGPQDNPPPVLIQT
jgi:hypothetical protein